MLRVINDDRVAAGEGFGTHPHRDMEIISYVLEGAIEHKDSMGTGSTVAPPGRRAADERGNRRLHSEFNPSKTEAGALPADLDSPREDGDRAELRAEDVSVAKKRRASGRPRRSREGRDGSVTVQPRHAAVRGQARERRARGHRAAPGAQGVGPGRERRRASVNDSRLGEGDGAAVEREKKLEISDCGPSEVLVFDLP